MPSKKSDQQCIDNVLEEAGPLIPYQIIIQVATTYLCLVTCYNNVLSLFTGDDPSWKCTGNTSSEFCSKYYNESITNDDGRYGQRCKLNRTEWTFNSERGYSFVTEYDLVCQKTWIAALVSSSYYIGGVIGCSVSGIAADSFGRKPVILISLFITCASMILSSFITDIWQLGVLNLIGGAGTYGSFMCCNVYQAEFIPPKYRAISTNILLTGFTLSFFLIDLFAYFIRDWRALSIYVALPSLLAMIMFCFLPESARWLLVNEKSKEANAVIEKVTKSEIPIGNNHIKSLTTTDQKMYSFADLFRNRTVLKLTLSIGTLWIMMSVIWYTIALEVSSLGGDMYQAFALSNISDLLSYVCAVVLCSRYGRKKCILGNFLAAGILLVILIIVRVAFSSRYTINIIVTSLARLAINTAAGGMFVWTNELFPTILRSRGYFFCALCDRLSVVTVPFITRLLQDINPILPYVISAALAVCGFFVGFLLPETLNQPTRETYEDFFPMKSEIKGVENDGVDNDEEHIIEEI